MDHFNSTQMASVAIKATLDGSGAVNSSTPRPRIPGPGDPPVKHPMVSVYIIIVVIFMLFTLLMWRGLHMSLMAARDERLAPKDPEYTHKTASVWVKLIKSALAAIKALIMGFLGIFSRSFWKGLWSDTKETCSPVSSCGICLNAYCCGLICNPPKDNDDTLPVCTQKHNNIITQDSMTMPMAPDIQRPAPTVAVEDMV